MTVPDLIDVCLPGEDAFMWYHLEYDGEDLEPWPCADRGYGHMPEATDYELNENGMLDQMLGVQWHNDASGEGWTFTSTWLRFAIEHLQIGQVAPDIQGKDLRGEALKLSDYRGKVVLLDFWGHW